MAAYTGMSTWGTQNQMVNTQPYYPGTEMYSTPGFGWNPSNGVGYNPGSGLGWNPGNSVGYNPHNGIGWNPGTSGDWNSGTGSEWNAGTSAEWNPGTGGWDSGCSFENNEVPQTPQINVQMKRDKTGLCTEDEVPSAADDRGQGNQPIVFEPARLLDPFPLYTTPSSYDKSDPQFIQSTSMPASTCIQDQTSTDLMSFGMGLVLLQKMGWKPGEGLGKYKRGNVEPIKVNIKNNKRGLLSVYDLPAQRGADVTTTVKGKYQFTGKHPVMLLGEYCSKLNLGIPIYETVLETGPTNKKTFIFKVKVNGVEYQPTHKCNNKKQAKAEAAELCLKSLGLQTSESSVSGIQPETS